MEGNAMLDDDEIDRLENIKRMAAGKAVAFMLTVSILLWMFLFGVLTALI
jgi:hypothetical protein